MEKLVWTDKLNTGIQVIDRQHRRLVDYINRLNDATLAGSSREALGELLEEVIDYTLTHFSFEETLMADVDYPGLKAHKESHDQFARQAHDLRERFRRNENTHIELNRLMVAWLFNHILQEDAGYAPAVLKGQ